MIKTVLLLIFLLPHSLWAVECDELNDLYKEKYRKEFVTTFFIGEFFCKGSVNHKLAQAFYSLDILDFRTDKSGHKPNFYEYVTKRINFIGYDMAVITESEKQGWIAYATGQQVFLTPNFFGSSKEMRVTTLIHEARHLDKDDLGHVECRQGDLKGSKACDTIFLNSPNKGSGYNASAYFSIWASYKSSKSDLFKKLIHNNLKYLLSNRFNKIDKKSIKRYSRLNSY